MTDFSDAEISAIESVSWERWIKDKKHGLSPQILLGMLLDLIAHQLTITISKQ